MKKLVLAGILSAAGAPFASACLPGDTRPTPAAVHFQVEPSEETLGGFTTADGWTITFDRLLVGLGGAGIAGDACNAYSDAPYARLFDFTAPGRQKLADVYGLGTCGPYVNLLWPGRGALLGEGVTEDDRAAMLELSVNPWGDTTGVTVYALGKAVRSGVEKRFEWRFGVGGVLRACPRSGDPGVELAGGREVRMLVTLHGEELFRESLEEGAGLRFDTMALADLDGDQRVTLEELTHVFPASPPLLSSDGGLTSLGDFMYHVLLPTIVHLDGSVACQTDTPSGPGP